MPDANQQVIDEFRANGGKVGGAFAGAPMLLLTTAGARTGRPHTNPAIYLRDGDRLLVFASNAGSDHNPAWYHNLLASPHVTVEIGERTISTRAVPLTGAERDHFWAAQCAAFPNFRAYERQTTRTIPVVALHPFDLSADPERNRVLGRQLRQHHADLLAALSRLRDELDDEPGIAEQLRERCLSFCYGLDLHHIRENGSFTAFEDDHETLRPAIAGLRAKHREVHAALEHFQDTIRAGGDPATLRAELAKVTDGLEQHFADEERLLLAHIA